MRPLRTKPLFLALLPVVALAAPSHASAQSRLNTPSQTDRYDIVSDAPGVDQSTQSEDVRFQEDRNDRMTVQVRLSGTGPYQFLVDTGADHSAISLDLARRLSLTNDGQKTMHSVTGVSQVGTATLPELDLQVKQLRQLEAALLESDHIGADGILGLDALKSQRILFDFKARTLTVTPSSAPVMDEEGTITVTARKRKGRLILTEARAEDTRIAVVVDTGSQVTIGNRALHEKLSRAGVVRRRGPVELTSVTGEKLVGEYMFVKMLEFGEVKLKDVAVVFADSHAFRQLDLERKPAILLGMNVFRAFDKVSIDFNRRKLRVLLPEGSGLEQAVMASR